MRVSHCRLVKASLVSLFLSPLTALAQESPPEELPEIAVLNEVQAIRDADLIATSQPVVVEGEMLFNGWFLATDSLTFKPGARLIFSSQALERRPNLFIVAREITSEDASNPGIISFEMPQISAASATPGQAPTGSHATTDGTAGGTGATGSTGITGASGYSAPSLTITTLSVPSSGPAIDFRGGLGAPGGQGQRGGDGGNGAKGTPGSQSLFDCKAGGGTGGTGGAGGTGGTGGVGGRGGTGGAVTIIAPAELLPSLSEKFRVLIAAGQGGDPGASGIGGNPGQPGPGGQEAKPYCNGGSGGAPGSAGAPGVPGQRGASGVDGDFFVGSISPDLFESLY